MAVNHELLFYQLKQAGLPVFGVTLNGDVAYERLLTDDELATGTAIITNHNPADLAPSQLDIDDTTQAKTGFRSLAVYATITPSDAETLVTNNVLSGKTKAEVETDIDNLPNTIAGIKAGMKVMAGAIIDLRNILSIVAKMVIYLRMIVIKRL